MRIFGKVSSIYQNFKQKRFSNTDM